MSESVPVILLEKWMNDLTANLKHASEEAENTDCFLYKGMKEGVGQVGRRIATGDCLQSSRVRVTTPGGVFPRVLMSLQKLKDTDWHSTFQSENAVA